MLQIGVNVDKFGNTPFSRFNTTENKEIAQALEDAGVNYKVSYVFVSTFKMIDVLSDNSKTIMNAQKARGVETEGNMLVRAKAFVPSIGSTTHIYLVVFIIVKY